MCMCMHLAASLSGGYLCPLERLVATVPRTPLTVAAGLAVAVALPLASARYLEPLPDNHGAYAGFWAASEFEAAVAAAAAGHPLGYNLYFLRRVAKAALELATSAFHRVIYITTPTAHPIHYPRLERMPAEFHALNARRTQRVNELERRVLTTFFPSVVSIDAHSLTGLLEDASLKCTDIRHHDFDANRQLMALLLAAVCGDDVEYTH